MNLKYVAVPLFLFLKLGLSQNNIELSVKLDTLHHILECDQKITYTNPANSTLKTLYFYAWSNSFKEKNTPLDKVMLENYDDSFHFAHKKERGYIFDLNISDNSSNIKDYNYKKNTPDVLIIKLDKPLKPLESIQLSLTYKIKVPSEKFTGYGRLEKRYHLKYTYIIPGIYHKNEWICYSNKGYDDLLTSPFDVKIKYSIPKKYFLGSNLNENSVKMEQGKRIYQLYGNSVKYIETIISKYPLHKIRLNKNLEVVLDVIPKISVGKMICLMNRNLSFLNDEFLPYKKKILLLTNSHIKRTMVLGLQKLPIIKLFSDDFKWDLNLFKVIANHVLNEKYNFDKRKELWMHKGLLLYLEQEYVKRYYPNKKLFGKISDWPIVNLFDLSKLKINDKNMLLHLFMERRGYGQPINTQTDSLINANKIFVSEIKSMLGFKYLENYVGKKTFAKSLGKLGNHTEAVTSSNHLRKLLNKYHHRNIDWYFDEFVSNTENLDFKVSFQNSKRHYTPECG